MTPYRTNAIIDKYDMMPYRTNAIIDKYRELREGDFVRINGITHYNNPELEPRWLKRNLGMIGIVEVVYYYDVHSVFIWVPRFLFLKKLLGYKWFDYIEGLLGKRFMHAYVKDLTLLI